MEELTPLPTSVTLRRFSIDQTKFSEDFEIWTLEFPFGQAIERYRSKVQSRLRALGKTEYLNAPYRQLNNALMTVCPTLTHGFEYAGKQKPYRALAVGVPSSPVQLPSPQSIRHVVREWALLWTKLPYITDNVPEDEQRTMRTELITAINGPLNEWAWRKNTARQLLGSFDSKETLNYTALPSLMATLLHDRESIIHGKCIRWRKVQERDGSNNKLSVVGFINQRPIWARYSIPGFRGDASGEGFGAYKLEFRLETQAGREDPWLFVSLHVQRYGDKPLTHPNERRRVSILTAANHARLDDFPVDTTLVRLQTREKDGIAEWHDFLAQLLEGIGASKLAAPQHIYDHPQSYWRPLGAGPDYSQDEYYIVHAEGYGYGDDASGHQLRVGLSMMDSAKVMDSVMNEHLTMLVPDMPLQIDHRPFSPVNTPRALRDYEFMSKPGRVRPDEMERMIQRALRGQQMLIAVLWNSPDTRDGIFMALRQALLLEPHKPFPPNVTVMDHSISAGLLDPLDFKNKNLNSSIQQRIRDWRAYLQARIPKNSVCFAIVEMLEDRWRIKGAARAACVSEGVTSQMVYPIRLKLDELREQVYVGGQKRHEHRANSVAREVLLRHVGGMYGDPQEIYQSAGIKDKNLEVIAFFLRQTEGNINYPIASRLTHDGTVEVMLPKDDEWTLYANAAPKLGRVFADERVNVIFDGSKNKIKDEKRRESALYYDKGELSQFILRTLKNLRYPTLVVIEADKWRNDGVWPQLRNTDLLGNWNVLNFEPFDYIQRNDPRLENLLGVIRMRSDRQTPQYLTDTLREFTQLTGTIDRASGDLMHYFSIGRELVTSKGQRQPHSRYAHMFDGIGAGVAFKYPQVVEFVPFFVREDYQNPDGLITLCRVPHYLRVSPAWPQGNIVLPYPMHLAQAVIEDQLCILGMDD
jgi:hypothetical protein